MAGVWPWLANTLVTWPGHPLGVVRILPVSISLRQEFIVAVHFSNTSMLSALVAPLVALTAWLLPFHTGRQQRIRSRPVAACPHQLGLPFNSDAPAPPPAPSPAATNNDSHHAAAPLSAPPLRVVRELDAAVDPACAGRMVISGRMADVCAELERMTRSQMH